LKQITEHCTANEIPNPFLLFRELLCCQNTTLKSSVFSALMCLDYRGSENKLMIDYLAAFDALMRSAVKSPEDCYLGMKDFLTLDHDLTSSIWGHLRQQNKVSCFEEQFVFVR
jgi:hypothetical protein